MFGDVEGSPCGGIILGPNGNEFKCEGSRRKTRDDIARRSTLFTLNHGEVGVMLLDCRCPICTYLNRCKGTTHGIFPVAHGRYRIHGGTYVLVALRNVFEHTIISGFIQQHTTPASPHRAT